MTTSSASIARRRAGTAGCRRPGAGRRLDLGHASGRGGRRSQRGVPQLDRGRAPATCTGARRRRWRRAGVDVLVMEMMRDTDYSVWATEDAIATGLPVWVGIAVERAPGWRTGRRQPTGLLARRDRRRARPARSRSHRHHALVAERHRSGARRRSLAHGRPARRLPGERVLRDARLALRRRHRCRRPRQPGHAGGSTRGRGSSVAAAGSRPTTSPVWSPRSAEPERHAVSRPGIISNTRPSVSRRSSRVSPAG